MILFLDSQFVSTRTPFVNLLFSISFGVAQTRSDLQRHNQFSTWRVSKLISLLFSFLFLWRCHTYPRWQWFLRGMRLFLGAVMNVIVISTPYC